MKTIRNIGLTILGILAALIVGLLALVYIPSPKFEPVVYEPVAPDYWPTDGFQMSSPEEQGMDSAILVDMVEFYQKSHAENPTTSIDSITIIRNGYVVADLYFNPLYPEDTSHIVHSCTKSIMSALIGIAIEQGYIASIDVPMVDFFEDKAHMITDERMTDITIEDLLSMKTGIRSRDYHIYQYEGWFEMLGTDDWVGHILSLPVDAEPGERFDYSNMSSFLLSAIIQEATGMDTLMYARENLFDPLGIKDIYWETSPQGIGIGSSRMWLKPHDMAKFGLLYLQQGQWNGEQIVPIEWIQESITPHAYPKNYVAALDANGDNDYDASRSNWASAKFFRAFGDGYGYQWWLDKSGSYSAVGVSGQYIMVVPEQNLVMVVTSSSSGLGVFFPKKLLDNYVLPAVESDVAIEANEAAQWELEQFSDPPLLDVEPTVVTELPPIALEISGQTYTLEVNNWNYDNFQFAFVPAQDFAEFSFTRRVHDVASFQVGLDGVYRYTETGIGTIAAYGDWSSPDTFEVFYQWVGYSAPDHLTITFVQDTIEVTETSVTGSTTFLGKAQ